MLSIREYISSSRNSSGKADEIRNLGAVNVTILVFLSGKKTKHGVSAIILLYASRVQKQSLNPFRRLLAATGSTFVSAKGACWPVIGPSPSHRKLMTRQEAATTLVSVFWLDHGLMGALWQAHVSNVRCMRLCRDFGVPDNLEHLMQSLANPRGFLQSSSMSPCKSLSCSLINAMYQDRVMSPLSWGAGGG